jgi:hypothetical protein
MSACMQVIKIQGLPVPIVRSIGASYGAIPGLAVSCWPNSDIRSHSDIRVSHPLQHPHHRPFSQPHPSGIESSLDSSRCSLRWPTTISSVNGLPSNILHTDTHCGSQIQEAHLTQIGPCRSAMSVLYAEANSIVFSTLYFQKTTHPTCSPACQNPMNPSSLPCRITSIRVLLGAIITVRLGSAWSRTQDIMPGNCYLHSEYFIADIVSARTTFGRSLFSMSGHEELQYYPCQ